VIYASAHCNISKLTKKLKMEAKNGSYYARLHKFKAGFGTAQNDAFSYESIQTQQVLIQYRIISFLRINVPQCNFLVQE